MAQRLVRAKGKIRHAGIPFRVPPAHLLSERGGGAGGRLPLFNEGYAASAGADRVRQNLAAEAIRLGRILAELLPDEPEADGLLALMLLHDARRDARFDATGELVLLEDQDRSCWDASQIAEGRGAGRAVSAAARPVPGPGGHRLLPRDRSRGRRHRLGADRRAVRGAGTACGSPVVGLNRAVAVARWKGRPPG